MNLMYIFKILSKEEWNKAINIRVYSGSSKHIDDGNIHFLKNNKS